MTLRQQMEADLQTIFNPDEFGVAALIQGLPVNGMFDDTYGEALGVGGTAPTFTCPASATDIAAEETLQIREVWYRVRTQKPDGQGLVVLTLELCEDCNDV